MQTLYKGFLSALPEQQRLASEIVSTMFLPANAGTLHLKHWFVSDDYNAIMNVTNDIL